ncbi:MAG: DUF6502 family protein [Gammaproteobacteria bacterium]
MKTTQDALIHSLTRLLRPLVRILLRLGIPYGSFAEVAKQVYVEVAAQDFPPPGRKQSDSRIATITGLTRKEVLRLKREPCHDGGELIEQYNRAARVISGWLSDPEFLDTRQHPQPLPLDGQGASFAGLVQRYSGDMPVRAIFDELQRVGAIQVVDECVVLQRAAYVPSADLNARIGILGTDVSELISTIDYNLDPQHTQTRFQLKVAYDHLPQEVLPAFHHLASQEGFRLLRELDAFLREHDRDCNPQSQGTGRMRAGVGIYYFEENLEQE